MTKPSNVRQTTPEEVANAIRKENMPKSNEEAIKVLITAQRSLSNVDFVNRQMVQEFVGAALKSVYVALEINDIEAAKDESVAAILESLQLKEAGKIKKVIVAGCLSERYKEELKAEMPEVDVFFGTEDYEGIIKDSKEEIKLGRRYWFLPRRCMLQWRHSGLVNAVTKIKDGSYKVRIEGLFIG